ncbi:hypothetical protein Gocc_0724 [Gaiella occulta]|uniref:Uncharacterized protein n=1 Tax=Gaiella occulta TaxID=1002870 RepID=A0A7M2YXQ4_9ACTN|nr:hypothetical protein [Gaiella occulta]RDI74926.1 hypothetical protein Gocc_0724 [Gaiella occulta]
MDISRLSQGAKLVVAATIAFLVVSIFNWQEVDFQGIASAGVSMWHGWGVLAGLIAIAILAWEGLRLAGIKIQIGLSPTMATMALAILLGLFTVLKFLVDNEFRTFWAWLGLLLAIAVVAGAFLNMQSAGESISELKTSVVAAAGSAATAAKEAVESATDKQADTPADTPADPPADPPADAAGEPPAARHDQGDDEPGRSV